LTFYTDTQLADAGLFFLNNIYSIFRWSLAHFTNSVCIWITSEITQSTVTTIVITV